jgi:hypothetical protein
MVLAHIHADDHTKPFHASVLFERSWLRDGFVRSRSMIEHLVRID